MCRLDLRTPEAAKAGMQTLLAPDETQVLPMHLQLARCAAAHL